MGSETTIENIEKECETLAGTSQERQLSIVIQKPAESNTLQKTDTQWYEELKLFFKDHFYLSDPAYYDVCACYELLAKRTQRILIVPYIYLIGPKASGKTRAMSTITILTRNPIKTAGITPAGLFHILDEKKPEILGLDESEFLNGVEVKDEFTSILNAGYEKGTPAIRVIKGENGEFEIKEYDVFGLKIVASTRTLQDTTMSRCIQIVMMKKPKDANIRSWWQFDVMKAVELRQWLIRYGEEHGKDEPSKPFNPQEYGGDRIADLFYPLVQVAPTPEVENSLKILAQKLGEQEDAKERDDTWEGLIVQSIQKVVEPQTSLAGSTQITFKPLPILGELTAHIENEWEKKQWTAKRLARQLDRLGFERVHRRDGAYWTTSRQRYSQLLERYGNN